MRVAVREAGLVKAELSDVGGAEFRGSGNMVDNSAPVSFRRAGTDGILTCAALDGARLLR
jgi:hypothetical protein